MPFNYILLECSTPSHRQEACHVLMSSFQRRQSVSRDPIPSPSSLGSLLLYLLKRASEHTTTATYRIQEAISDISKWTLDWGLKINTSKTNSTLFSLSTTKEQIKLRLKGEIVLQTDNTTFLGVKLDTRLTWKPQIEKMERSSLKKLALMRKLAGTSWGADSSILTKVYTATVRPTMEYTSTTWGTAAKTNKSRLDKIQNMALQIILGTMKTTPVHDMGKKQPMWSHLRGEEVSKSSFREKN